MLKVGLTGGIASGKTRISDLFSQSQVPVIDTDIISREILQPDQPGYLKIKDHFSADIIDSDGNINRLKLRQVIFNNSAEKSWLEAILHPIIFEQTQQQIKQYIESSYVIVVIPLLFETNFASLVDRILVVDCKAEIQIERLLQRDKIDSVLAKKILEQQWSNQDRLTLADDIIHNNSNLDLRDQVILLHQKYLALSK